MSGVSICYKILRRKSIMSGMVFNLELYPILEGLVRGLATWGHSAGAGRRAAARVSAYRAWLDHRADQMQPPRSSHAHDNA